MSSCRSSWQMGVCDSLNWTKYKMSKIICAPWAQHHHRGREDDIVMFSTPLLTSKEVTRVPVGNNTKFQTSRAARPHWKDTSKDTINCLQIMMKITLFKSRTTDWCALAAHHILVISSWEYLISHWLAISSSTNEKSDSLRRKPLDYGKWRGRISQSSLT